MPVGTFNITADSVPVLDGWGYDYYWGCNHWIQWHALRKSKYGKPKADNDFITWFLKQSTGASGYDCRTFNSEFRDYVNAENLKPYLYDGVEWIMPILNAAGTAIESSNAIIDAAGNIVKNAAKDATWLSKWGVPIIGTIAGTAFAIFLVRIAKSASPKMSKK